MFDDPLLFIQCVGSCVCGTVTYTDGADRVCRFGSASFRYDTSGEGISLHIRVGWFAIIKGGEWIKWPSQASSYFPIHNVHNLEECEFRGKGRWRIKTRNGLVFDFEPPRVPGQLISFNEACLGIS